MLFDFLLSDPLRSAILEFNCAKKSQIKHTNVDE